MKMKSKLIGMLILCLAIVSNSYANDSDNLKNGFTIGTPVLKSIQAIAFGPENILFIGDNTGSTRTRKHPFYWRQYRINGVCY